MTFQPSINSSSFYPRTVIETKPRDEIATPGAGGQSPFDLTFARQFRPPRRRAESVESRLIFSYGRGENSRNEKFPGNHPRTHTSDCEFISSSPESPYFDRMAHFPKVYLVKWLWHCSRSPVIENKPRPTPSFIKPERAGPGMILRGAPEGIGPVRDIADWSWNHERRPEVMIIH